jgi:hypothetical protein
MELPKKAYLVSSGSYSDYDIADIFLDKAAAEKYCAVRNAEDKFCDPYYVEEYDINDGSGIDTSEQVLWYYHTRANVIMHGPRAGELEKNVDFNFNAWHACKLILSGDNRRPNTWRIVEQRSKDTVYGYDIEIYLDHENDALASKIAQDRWNEFKAELEGVKL